MIDATIPLPATWVPAEQGHLDAAHPLVTEAPSAPVDPVADAVPPQTAVEPPLEILESSTQESAPEGTSRERIEPDIVSAAAPRVTPAVQVLSRTTMLKLDSVQTTWLGAGILLGLSFQLAIIVILLWQRYQHPFQVAPLVPVHGRSTRALDRAPAVADFAAADGLWDAGFSSIGRQWQSEEDSLRNQEATIIEEVVARNVTMAHELAQS